MSVLFGLGDAQVRGAVRRAHDKAVREAVGHVERTAAVRRGHGGLVVEPAGGLIVGLFRHRTSRVGDPQLHTHAVVANLGRGPDGRWSTLDRRSPATWDFSAPPVPSGSGSSTSAAAGPDALVCFMEDTRTPAERNLARMGRHQRLRDMLTFFQYAAPRGYCEPVERITGRKVRSFHSSIDTKVDGLAIETFILNPEGEDGAVALDLTADDEI